MAEEQSASEVRSASGTTPGAAPVGGAPPRYSLSGIVVRLAVVLLAATIVFLFVTRWDAWVGARTRQTTDDAYARADITPLSAQVEGYVRRVAVTDFQHVKAGDVLVEIDDEDYQARVAQAEADLLGAEAAIQNLKAHKAQQHAVIDQAQSAIAATEADVVRTKQELVRQRTL